MAKIVCEICGTEYQDAASGCPICGWVQDGTVLDEEDVSFDLDLLKDELMPENTQNRQEETEVPLKPRKNREIFDFDAVNTAEEKKKKNPAPVYAEEYDDEEEEGGGVNVLLVVFLVIVIVALLLTTGFILFRYYLPGRNAAKETTEPVATEEIVEETTIPTIPCTSLVLPNGIDVLKQEGQYWLLHLVKTPEDTTDTVIYASEDESIATVTEDGRVTAIGEGETNIVITCGEQTISCPVIVRYEEETEPAETEPVETAAVEEAGNTAETEAPAEETAAPTEAETVPANVTLKLKKSDIQIGRMGVYVDLALDCELNPEQVTWITSNSNVVLVKDGRVTAMGPGIATVTARYGGQEATCIVRCKF